MPAAPSARHAMASAGIGRTSPSWLRSACRPTQRNVTSARPGSSPNSRREQVRRRPSADSGAAAGWRAKCRVFSVRSEPNWESRAAGVALRWHYLTTNERHVGAVIPPNWDVVRASEARRAARNGQVREAGVVPECRICSGSVDHPAVPIAPTDLVGARGRFPPRRGSGRLRVGDRRFGAAGARRIG